MTAAEWFVVTEPDGSAELWIGRDDDDHCQPYLIIHRYGHLHGCGNRWPYSPDEGGRAFAELHARWRENQAVAA